MFLLHGRRWFFRVSEASFMSMVMMLEKQRMGERGTRHFGAIFISAFFRSIERENEFLSKEGSTLWKRQKKGVGMVSYGIVETSADIFCPSHG